MQAPVQNQYECSEECYQEAEVAVTPDPDREGQEHDSDGGDVNETVEVDHPVHQRVLLYLEPDKYYDIDQKDCEIIGYEYNKIKCRHFPIRINKNCFCQVNKYIQFSPVRICFNVRVYVFSFTHTYSHSTALSQRETFSLYQTNRRPTLEIIRDSFSRGKSYKIS